MYLTKTMIPHQDKYTLSRTQHLVKPNVPRKSQETSPKSVYFLNTTLWSPTLSRTVYLVQITISSQKHCTFSRPMKLAKNTISFREHYTSSRQNLPCRDQYSCWEQYSVSRKMYLKSYKYLKNTIPRENQYTLSRLIYFINNNIPCQDQQPRQNTIRCQDQYTLTRLIYLFKETIPRQDQSTSSRLMYSFDCQKKSYSSFILTLFLTLWKIKVRITWISKPSPGVHVDHWCVMVLLFCIQC